MSRDVSAAPKEWYSEEIKRLLGEIAQLTAEGKTWHDCYDNERRENERLKADWKPDRGSLVEYQLLAEAQAENDRLRAAHQEIRELVNNKIVSDAGLFMRALLIARRALEPKMNNDTATYHARQERGDGHMPPGEGAAFANGAAARQPEIDRLCAERLAFATESEERKAEIERLTAERDNILKAVLHHFGPEGANKVCTSVLDGKP